PLRPQRPGLHMGEHRDRPGGRRTVGRLGLATTRSGDAGGAVTPPAAAQVYPLVEARGLDRVLDYAGPPHLDDVAVRGALVACPLGRRRVLGVVAGREAPSHEGRLVALAGVVDAPPLPGELLDLALWVARYYLAPSAACLRLVLPPGADGAL